MTLTVAEWFSASEHLRAAGNDALADFYAENAKLVRDGQAPIWPIPPELKASTRIAAKAEPEPAPFVSDGREP